MAPAGSALSGLRGRCPRCGVGKLYAGPLTLSIDRSCASCGLDYSFADPGDGPAVFAIFILGVLALGGALIAEFKLGVPIWGHVLLWGFLLPLFALWLLRGLKGALVAQQFKYKAEQARSPVAPRD